MFHFFNRFSPFGVLAAFLLSACFHNPPKPHGAPFPINTPAASQSAPHSTPTTE